MLRARTPLGGRAATPGGFVARGLARSLGVVSYPWAPQPRGMHIEERGGLRYLAGLARKVRLAPRGCGPCPCLAAATVCTCGCGAGPVSCCCAALTGSRHALASERENVTDAHDGVGLLRHAVDPHTPPPPPPPPPPGLWPRQVSAGPS